MAKMGRGGEQSPQSAFPVPSTELKSHTTALSPSISVLPPCSPLQQWIGKELHLLCDSPPTLPALGWPPIHLDTVLAPPPDGVLCSIPDPVHFCHASVADPMHHLLPG